ncbi:MAG: BlaI/MecI/CopY family transcriptional regulator [Pseudohongiellaceae bacterium]
MQVTNPEIQVLDVLWNESPLTVGQIIERVQADSDWHHNTIKTILTRLVKKNAVQRKKDGGQYFYWPELSREAFLSSRSDGFLDQFFNGRMAPLLAHFAERKKLTRKDINEIEQVLESLKKRK